MFQLAKQTPLQRLSNLKFYITTATAGELGLPWRHTTTNHNLRSPPTRHHHTTTPIMTPITAFDVSIALNLRGLRALRSLLAKAVVSPHPRTTGTPASDKVQGVPALAFHVQACTGLATGGLRILSRAFPATDSDPDSDSDSQWKPDDTTTLEQLIAHVEQAIVWFENSSVDAASLEGIEDESLPVTYGNGQTAQWGGREYILGYNIPNFMFHLCMVYSTLKAQGVDVGKMDYLLPFMAGMAPSN